MAIPSYCPRCGQALASRFEGGRDRPACPSCRFVHFGDYSIGVGGVVIREGKALLIRRGQEPYKGWWQIPGGYAEHDELIEQAVEREVFEESGVHARARRVLGLRNAVGDVTNVYVIFALDLLDGEVRQDAIESVDAGFFSLEEMEGMEMVQNLSKWAIRAALSGQPGFARVETMNQSRPDYQLYGLEEE
ncbi:MAG: NUDIX domain-containing protein [Chloroflexota bacterium]